jgi:hypothetical protein
VQAFDPVRSVVLQGYLNRDQSHKTAYAGQLLVSTAKEAAPEHEVAPVPRRTFTKVGRWASASLFHFRKINEAMKPAASQYVDVGYKISSALSVVHATDGRRGYHPQEQSLFLQSQHGSAVGQRALERIFVSETLPPSQC